MELNFEEMVREILARTKISRDELMLRIRKKQDEHSGFITLEGCAFIVGRELGVIFKKGEPEVQELRIGDLAPGMSKVDIVGRVVRVYEPTEFIRRTGDVGRVGSLLLEDRTGRVRLVLWDERASIIEKGEVRKGDVIRAKNAYVREGIDKQPELSLGGQGSIEVDPDDPRARELPPLVETKVRLADLKPEMGEVDLLCRVVAKSSVRKFERHDGSVGKVATLILVDSSGQVRASIWDEKAELVNRIERGDALKLENATVRSGLGGKPELSLGAGCRLILNPPDPGVANLPLPPERPLKIEEIETEMPTLDLVARVRRVFPLQEFRRDDGTTGRVVSAFLADETGTIRASFWGESADLAKRLQPNDVLLIKNARARPGLAGRPEVHIGRETTVEVNPPSVEVGELLPSAVKLGELEPGLDALEVIARVIDVSGSREFTRTDGSKGKVASLLIGDQTGTARVSLWQEHAERVNEIKVGDAIRLLNCYSSPGLFGQPELHLGKQGTLEINPRVAEELPPADVLKLVAPATPPRVSIAHIKREGERVQIRGTVVRVFHRRPLFDVCPECGRSLGSVDTSLMCEQCGKIVKPEHRAVLTFMLDDGTGVIRAALFGKVVEQLLGMNARQIFELFKSIPDLSKLYDRFGLLGKEIILSGTTRYDKYFDQLELRASDVQVPEPRREARALLESIKAGK